MDLIRQWVVRCHRVLAVELWMASKRHIKDRDTRQTNGRHGDYPSARFLNAKS